MNHILIYADSLTWGIIPNTRKRLSFEKRWPGVFEASTVDGIHLDENQHQILGKAIANYISNVTSF